MKRIRLGKVASFTFYMVSCVIVFVLMAAAWAAPQQEVDPEHFDNTPTKAQSRTAVPHHRRTKTALKRTTRKRAATAKSDAEKAQRKAGSTSQVAR